MLCTNKILTHTGTVMLCTFNITFNCNPQLHRTFYEFLFTYPNLPSLYWHSKYQLWIYLTVKESGLLLTCSVLTCSTSFTQKSLKNSVGSLIHIVRNFLMVWKVFLFALHQQDKSNWFYISIFCPIYFAFLVLLISLLFLV